ncbi:sugar ABC transporter ATP-binding protein [Yoonia sediminilitoris]|uniref:Monosaccharide ABC transporter ATP-binding protein (CUT2 family) n=1 Tax=Yoonia sediminilitoris TaxID=1286148 RepID=A0A2T6KAR6_9RHOB|nr:sugar ABC transporter ATP-binding protein [Yoonia sediminilitoris]PUB11882.1 monosaccharide ABC transporter ATP-binding protein (CUT2 family) [Yoonia sediminilitoris]RCW91959.1 monosaccharide ABC transporter ATP-binding protein (CUT2 family) [Yoonia sediminilitoris]
MTTHRLNIAGVTKSFGPVKVLHGVDLKIAPGSVVGLLGENGAGKSTLMNIVSGSLRQDAGHLHLDGTELALQSVRDGIDLGIRFVHQELSTIGSLSVAENIFLGDYLAGRAGVIKRRDMAARSQEALASVGLDRIDPNTIVETLRPGQQQLIEIAKAVVVQPRLLILDEPTSSLTSVEAAKLFELMRKLAADGAAVIFITHKLEEALNNCDRIVVLRDGALVSDELADQTDKARLIHHMVGKSSVFEWKGSAAKASDAQISIRGLCDADAHLSPVSLDVGAGEVVALFGLVGAGRTEFMETLFGFRKAAGGEVFIHGRPLRLGHVPTSVRNGVAMVPEGRKVRGILPSHSVERNISASNLDRLSRFGLMRAGAEQGAAADLAASLRIKMENAKQVITRLSGGNQQKAVFARAVMVEPRLLLLDEPTHGVDVGAKSEIYEIIHELALKGMSVIVSSSELPEVLAIADRCVVFSQGEMVGSLTRSEMSEGEILRLAFANH